MFRDIKILLAASLVAVMLPTSGFALVEGEVLVGYSLGYDDNINLGTESQSLDEDITNELYFDVELAKPTGFFRYDVFGRAGFTAHSASQVSDQFNVSGGADVLWLIVPNRFSWDISDVAEVRRRDSGALASSSNTEQTNVFRTGPTVYFRPFQRTTLNLGGFYQQSWYEFGDSNEYVGASAETTYLYSPLSTWDGYASEVHYLPDGGNFSDQVNRNVGWRYNRRLQRGAWLIGSGMSQVVVDQGQTIDDPEEWIPTYTAGLSLRLARSWSFHMNAERQVTTIGEDALDAPGRTSLLNTLDSSTDISTSTPTTTTPTTSVDLGSLRTEVDEFQYASGFNVSDKANIALHWDEAQWGAQIRGFARSTEVPEFQLDLSQEARQLLFPNAVINAGEEAYGLELSVSVEPKPRWVVGSSVRVENKDVRSINVLEVSPTEDPVFTRELRETRVLADVTYAASRYLSFGASIENVTLVDRNAVVGDVVSNRVSFAVEYSL